MEKRITVPSIAARKGSDPLVVLTAYTAPVARLLDPHVDILLVGDSLGMVLYGMETTMPVTLDMMIAHGRAVVQSSEKALVVVDMPFGSYQASSEQAFINCARVLVETGAQAVKLEGGVEMADTIRHLTSHGIAVMGHVGLLPQRVHALGGYRSRGRDEEEAAQILKDAQAIEKAGVFAMVIEAVQEPVARAITDKVKVPTIGIGASPACDGQVLVSDDMLGLTERVPGFVKRYADLAGAISKAAETYASDVRAGKFPGAEHYAFKKKKS